MCNEDMCNKRKLWVKGAKSMFSGQMLKAEFLWRHKMQLLNYLLCSHCTMFGTANVTVLPREFNTENGNNPAEINTGKRYFFVYLSKHKAIHCKSHQVCVTFVSFIRFFYLLPSLTSQVEAGRMIISLSVRKLQNNSRAYWNGHMETQAEEQYIYIYFTLYICKHIEPKVGESFQFSLWFSSRQEAEF